jgi:hypothetical protein
MGANVLAGDRKAISESVCAISQAITRACENFDANLGVHRSLTHTDSKRGRRCARMLQELVEADVWSFVGGRCHAAFKNFEASPFKAVDPTSFVAWIDEMKSELFEDQKFRWERENPLIGAYPYAKPPATGVATAALPHAAAVAVELPIPNLTAPAEPADQQAWHQWGFR